MQYYTEHASACPEDCLRNAKLMRGGSVLPTILSRLHAEQANMVSNVSTSKMKDDEKLEIDASEHVLQFYRNALSKCVIMNDEGID